MRRPFAESSGYKRPLEDVGSSADVDKFPTTLRDILEQAILGFPSAFRVDGLVFPLRMQRSGGRVCRSRCRSSRRRRVLRKNGRASDYEQRKGEQIPHGDLRIWGDGPLRRAFSPLGHGRSKGDIRDRHLTGCPTRATVRAWPSRRRNDPPTRTGARSRSLTI